MIDDDCDLDALKGAVLEAVRARSDHRLRLRESPPPLDWQATADGLEQAYRRARDAWEACVDDLSGPFG